MLLTMRDRQRIEAIQMVMDGKLAVEEAGRVLKRSMRQVFRLLKKLREERLKGLIHGNLGRESLRRIPDQVRRRILFLVQDKFRDINDTHLKEILFLSQQAQKNRFGQQSIQSL